MQQLYADDCLKSEVTIKVNGINFLACLFSPLTKFVIIPGNIVGVTLLLQGWVSPVV